MTSRPLREAISLLTVLPVPGPPTRPGPGVVLRLPVVGLLVGALAFVPALAVWRGGVHGSPLLAAVLVVAAAAALTRGLHLDGLADLADGLGSRRPPAEAVQIMRRSDVGPFGVVTLVLTLGVQVASLATVLADCDRVQGLVVVTAAAVTGRLAIVLAAGPGVPLGTGSSFGALIAGNAGAPARLAWVFVTLAVATGAATASGAGAARIAAGVLAALIAADLLRRHAVRRLGGVSGDVFGALVEAATTVALLVPAGAVGWQAS